MVPYFRRTQRGLASLLGISLALPLGATAQPQSKSGSPAVSQPATVRDLKVVPLAGDREMNDLERRVMAPLVVQVRDQSDLPVDGAEVTFRFTLEGTSASFSGQKTAQTFRTNADGQAAATGWMSNGHVGTFRVQVTAIRGDEMGSAVISMTNVTRITEKNGGKPKHWWSTGWGKAVLVAGVAGIVSAVLLSTRGGSSSSGRKVITITPGSPTIGGPQ